MKAIELTSAAIQFGNRYSRECNLGNDKEWSKSHFGLLSVARSILLVSLEKYACVLKHFSTTLSLANHFAIHKYYSNTVFSKRPSQDTVSQGTCTTPSYLLPYCFPRFCVLQTSRSHLTSFFFKCLYVLKQIIFPRWHNLWSQRFSWLYYVCRKKKCGTQ